VLAARFGVAVAGVSATARHTRQVASALPTVRVTAPRRRVGFAFPLV
jgi:hypothetical protein